MIMSLTLVVHKQIPVSMVAMGTRYGDMICTVIVSGFLSTLGFDPLHTCGVVYGAMFYYVIRCLTRLYVFFHSALSHHSIFSSDCVPAHIVDLWY